MRVSLQLVALKKATMNAKKAHSLDEAAMNAKASLFD